MEELPHQLYRATQVRKLDQVAIEEFNIPGTKLTENAGKFAFHALRAKWPESEKLTIFCGIGNNGGDGYVVARLAKQAGLQTRIIQVGSVEKIKGDALSAYHAMLRSGVEVETFSSATRFSPDVVVDGLLGTGLKGEVAGEWRAAIEAINQSNRPVLALDIPSGLHADTGQILGLAVHATLTVTFIGLKQGLFTADGAECCGEIRYSDLAVPPEVFSNIPSSAIRLDKYLFKDYLQPRSRVAHKGFFGHVLLVGGDSGMSGATRLAGEAAARVGAGLVSIATRTTHAEMLNNTRPELMCHGVEGGSDLGPLLKRATVVGIGPGLGQRPWARSLLSRVIDSQLPLVVDADGLNLLSQNPVNRGNWILTPHPGEAARLLNCSTKEIQQDRFAAIRELQEQYGGVIVLKGSGTLVSSEDLSVGLCSAGNPGMASGGMGDVLSGVIAGLLAQKFSLKQAACIGVTLHAVAADMAARSGERGILAGDLMEPLHYLVNPNHQ